MSESCSNLRWTLPKVFNESSMQLTISDRRSHRGVGFSQGSDLVAGYTTKLMAAVTQFVDAHPVPAAYSPPKRAY